MRDAPSAADTRVISLGISAQDYIWRVERMPDAPVKTRAQGFAETGGGIAATAAVTVARLGGAAEFWGRAGDDPAGRAMYAELSRYGVDTAYFRLFPGGRSSVSAVFVDAQGERLIINFPGANLPDDTAWLPLDRIAGTGAVLADVNWRAGAAALFAAARCAGVPTVLDADIAERSVYAALLPLADYPIFSMPGLRAFAPSAKVHVALRQAAGQARGWAAVTLGVDGVVWCDGERCEQMPAFAVAVVDSTGAGDVFHGAFAHAVASGTALPEALRLASAVAALKCTAPGGREGIPDRHAAEKLLKDTQ